MQSKRDNREKPVEYIKGKVSIKLLLPESHFPSKEEGRESDIGYDITLVQRSENRAEDTTHEVNNFRTGISLTPPDGYYIEMIASSSLHKHGYFLATGTSIISPGYTGELIVPLYKYKEMEDIELPFKAVQIIVKPAVHSHMSSVKSLQSSTRGEGNFSSPGFEVPGAGLNQGVYIQDPQASNYPGDMSAYSQQVQSYGKGQSRPQSAPRSNNHIF